MGFAANPELLDDVADDEAEDAEDAEDDAELELDDELLLPQPTTAATQITESGAASQLLHVRISFLLVGDSPRSWRQDKRTNGLLPEPLTL